MKDSVPFNIEKYRVTQGPLRSNSTYGFNGAFFIPYANETLKVIVSDGRAWDHVSISLPNRCPTWRETHWVKRLFFKDTETAIQIHAPEKDYINVCENCLHIWRPQKYEIPLPPKFMLA